MICLKGFKPWNQKLELPDDKYNTNDLPPVQSIEQSTEQTNEQNSQQTIEQASEVHA